MAALILGWTYTSVMESDYAITSSLESHWKYSREFLDHENFSIFYSEIGLPPTHQVYKGVKLLFEWRHDPSIISVVPYGRLIWDEILKILLHCYETCAPLSPMDITQHIKFWETPCVQFEPCRRYNHYSFLLNHSSLILNHSKFPEIIQNDLS